MGCFRLKDYNNRNRREKIIEEMEEQLQISSSAIKIKIAGLLGQLRRELGKTKAKESGQALTNYKSQWLYWDRLEFLVAVMQAGKSINKKDKTLK